MNFTEKKLSSEEIYNGKIIKVRLDKVELPDGSSSFREYVRHCGGAAVLYVKEGKIALVKQYRYVYGKEIYEIPAGKIDEGESGEEAAKRELEEETGYRATALKKLLDVYPSPGYTDEVIAIYYAPNADFVGEKHDEGEFLSAQFFPVCEVKKMIDEGVICDAKTVAAVYKYLSFENKN